jgi:protein-tyrosine-phosphatase
MFSIAFICTANLCRSVMAHAICVPEVARRSLPVEVYSAGILDFEGMAPAVAAWITCCKHSTPPLKEEATFVRDLPLSSINRFLVMEHQHVECLVKEYDVPPERISLLGSFDPKGRGAEIGDPMNQGTVVFECSYARIRECILHYLDTAPEIQPRHG